MIENIQAETVINGFEKVDHANKFYWRVTSWCSWQPPYCYYLSQKVEVHVGRLCKKNYTV